MASQTAVVPEALARAAVQTARAEAEARRLAAALGPFGYQWLCACAVYPVLRFSLSTYLGAVVADLLERPRPAEDEHLALFRLPWFRQGWMPDDLRVRLIQDIYPAIAPQVREAVACAAYSMTAQSIAPGGTSPVPVLAPPRNWNAMLSAHLALAAGGSVEDDNLFRRFASGRPVRASELARTERLERLLGRSLRPWMHGPGLAVLVAALLSASAAATAGWWLRPFFERTVELADDPQQALPPIENTDLNEGVEEPVGNTGGGVDSLPTSGGGERDGADVTPEPANGQEVSSTTRPEQRPPSEKPTPGERTAGEESPSKPDDPSRFSPSIFSKSPSVSQPKVPRPFTFTPPPSGTEQSGETEGDRPAQEGGNDPATAEAPSGEGDSGDTVRNVQLSLQALGFYTGGADGRQGAATTNAIRAFQRSRGLTPTGRITEQLLEALSAASEEAK